MPSKARKVRVARVRRLIALWPHSKVTSRVAETTTTSANGGKGEVSENTESLLRRAPRGLIWRGVPVVEYSGLVIDAVDATSRRRRYEPP